MTRVIVLSGPTQHPPPAADGETGVTMPRVVLLLALSILATTSVAAPPSGDPPDGGVPIESLDLDQLLGRDVRAGETGAWAARLSERGFGFEVHGALTTDFIWAIGEGEKPTFDLHHAMVLLRANVADRVIPELGVEWEHGGEETYLPLAFVDLVASEALIVRAGLFPTPIGVFNAHVYPDFQRKTVGKPSMFSGVVPALWTSIGVQLRGRFPWSEGDSAFNYAVFVANGLQQKDGGEGGDLGAMHDNVIDPNADKGLGGRLGVTLGRGLDLGVSGYTGMYTSDRRLSLFDADVTVQRADLTLRAEGAMALQEIAGGRLIKYGVYVLLAWRAAAWIEPYAQSEVAALDDGREMQWTEHAGLVYYPFPEILPLLMVKLEGSVTTQGGDVSGHVESQITFGL